MGSIEEISYPFSVLNSVRIQASPAPLRAREKIVWRLGQATSEVGHVSELRGARGFFFVIVPLK